MEIFKAYDIRGIYPSHLNEEIAYKIGRAFVTLLDCQKVIIGRDGRLSSESLFQALSQGVVDQGAEVIDIGLAATPTFYFAVSNCGDSGIMITASHNPKEWNGFKLCRERAISLSSDSGIKEIKILVEKNEFENRKKGKIIKKENVLQEQIKNELGWVDLKKIKPFKIVLDPANGVGLLYLEELFKHLPCQTIKMNFDLDGTFSHHPPDPLVEENLIFLQEKVREEKADLGVALDGDGDRIFFVDEKGKTLEPAILRGILAKAFLKDNPGAKICYDIRPGKITEEMILEAGGIPIVTKVGHSLIKEKMREEKAIFAGESSGHYFLKVNQGYYEVPMIAILKLLEILSESNQPLSEYIKPYQKYFHSGEINLKVEDKEKKILEIEKIFCQGKINKLDGLTVEFDDWWFNLRPSNTEPYLRLNLEAKSKEIMEEKKNLLLFLLKE